MKKLFAKICQFLSLKPSFEQEEIYFRVICPECKVQMINDIENTLFLCPNCLNKYRFFLYKEQDYLNEKRENMH